MIITVCEPTAVIYGELLRGAVKQPASRGDFVGLSGLWELPGFFPVGDAQGQE